MKREVAVIGCGFGDEGKGRVVDCLCSHRHDSIVVRFSGGHQAGHHVVTETKEHVFSNFGSGSLRGVPTYWSRFCTVDPIGILNELYALSKIDVSPKLFIDKKCPVTTIFDKAYNCLLDSWNKHGTCGVGFGQTIQREEDRCSLLFEDLFNPTIFEIKLEMIKKYYGNKIAIGNEDFCSFVRACKRIIDTPNVYLGDESTISTFDSIIFEGSQGLLLDQDIGFFPHVTRANTGSRNILKMGFEPEIILVTRAYQTRHGNGPMTNENLKHNIKPNPFERNIDGGLQGKFRTSPLDLDLLKYAISRDDYIKTAGTRLVITCLDLVCNQYTLTNNGKFTNYLNEERFVEAIGSILGIRNIYLSHSPLENIQP